VKPPVAMDSSRIRHGPIRKSALRARHMPRRECIALSDPTDCLLEAYDCVARRAYENFIAQGPRPGGEMDDWLNAERELLLGFAVNLENSENFVYALASVPGATAERVVVGVESRWLVILAQSGRGDPIARAKIHTDASRIPESRPTSVGVMEPRAAIPAGSDPIADDSCAPPKSVCVLELPADVDAAHSVAVICDGLIGIRMPKSISRA
jgi:hypothetical protein